MIVLCALIVILICCFIKILWDHKRLYYYVYKIPGPNIFFLVLNNLKSKKDAFEFIHDLFKEYGNVYRIIFLQHVLIVINSPVHVKTILANCLEKDSVYDFGKSLIGDGLFTASSNKWKKKRKKLALLFNPRILNTFFDVFYKYSLKLADQLEKHVDEECNIFPLVQQFTLDVICETSLGVEVNAMSSDNSYGAWMNRGESLVVKRSFSFFLRSNFIWQFTNQYKELCTLAGKSWAFIRNILEEKQKLEVSNFSDVPPNFKCFVDQLLVLSPEINREELIEEAQTFVIAGSQTTATADCTTLLLLAFHPEIQKKVHKELDEIFEKSERPLTIEDLSQMKYLEQVIKESLRIIPVAPIILRKAPFDIELDKLTIPKGASIMVPVLSVHRNPEVWPNPTVFDPDRFLPKEVAKRHPCSFIPFASGPRNCIGMRYAFMSIKIMLATVLRRYRVVTNEYESVEDILIRLRIVTKFIKGHKVKLERRNFTT